MSVGHFEVGPHIVLPLTVAGLDGLLTVPAEARAEAVPVIPVLGVLVGAVHRGGHSQLVRGLGQGDVGSL